MPTGLSRFFWLDTCPVRMKRHSTPSSNVGFSCQDAATSPSILFARKYRLEVAREPGGTESRYELEYSYSNREFFPPEQGISGKDQGSKGSLVERNSDGGIRAKVFGKSRTCPDGCASASRERRQ